jgi:hypothetical protein
MTEPKGKRNIEEDLGHLGGYVISGTSGGIVTLRCCARILRLWKFNILRT